MFIVSWSTDRQRSHRSIYFPLEIFFSPDTESISYTEFIGNQIFICVLLHVNLLIIILYCCIVGIRIDFILDPNWGQVESIFIPMLCSGQLKKTCMHLQPKVCSEIIIGARYLILDSFL